jgi:plastocyanin
MTIDRLLTVTCTVLAVMTTTASPAQKKNPYACTVQTSASSCSAANMCGSPSQPCTIDVKRTNYGASATPAFPGSKGNATFCVKAGTTVVWKSDTKHQGFIVDMGPASPFNLDDIIGGSDKSVTVTANKPGCYRYSVGACISGEIYGMCGNSNAQIIVVK